MARVASLYLPEFAIERLRRLERPRAQPDRRLHALLPVDDDPGPCSVPRGGGWRPGARWAHGELTCNEVAAGAAALPSHQQPSIRELGRRSEAAEHPFKGGTLACASNPPNYDFALADLAPLVLAAALGQRQVLTACSPAAREFGLSAGMALTQARVLVPNLDVRAADPIADRTMIGQLVHHAVRYWTPTAAPDGEDGLWLDLTGVTHLHGGEQLFCRRLLTFLARLGFTARVAVAGTPGAAHALARFTREPIVQLAAGDEAQMLAILPVACLRLSSDALRAATRFGLERVGDLLQLPRGPLARRLGLATIERLDQALGRAPEPIVPVAIEEVPSAERRLLEPISTAEAIETVIGDLLADLIALLQGQARGVRALTLTLDRIDNSEQRVTLGTAGATRDAAHLARLFHLRIEKIEPGSGIERMRLAANLTETLGARPLAARLAGEEMPADVATLVDQLAGRVGGRAIFTCSAVESDVPERAVRRDAPLAAPAGWPAWKRPTRLLPRPEPLINVLALLPDHPPRRFTWRGEVHAVVSGDGPERIHGEWWRRDGEVWAVRDYFRVEDEDGGRFWVFRRGDGIEDSTGDLSWYMHGLFG